MSRSKKQEELIIMRYFAECYTDFPKGKLIQGESPDFKLSLSKRKHINIELTQIYLPDKKTFQMTPDVYDLITELIQMKNEKLYLYNRNKPYANWLIIYSENIELPSNNGLYDHFSDDKNNHQFDKIFLFDLFSGRITHLGLPNS